MKLKKILTMFLITIFISTPLQALEIPVFENAFTYRNVDNTIVSNGSTYILASDGTVRVVGYNARGLGQDSQHTDEWRTISKNPNGDAVTNIVAIEDADSGLLMLDADGYVWSIGDMVHPGTTEVATYKIAKKCEMYSNICQVVGGASFTNQYNALLDTQGRTYVSQVGFTGETFMSNGEQTNFKEIYEADSNGTFMALDIENKLYQYDKSTNTWVASYAYGGYVLDNIKEVFTKSNIHRLLLTYDNSLFMTNGSNNYTVKEIVFPDGVEVLDVLPINGYSTYAPIYVLTNEGYYTLDPTATISSPPVPQKVELNFTPAKILIADNVDCYAILDTDGYVNLMTTGKNTAHVEDNKYKFGFASRNVAEGETRYRLDWMNDLLLTQTEHLSRFEIISRQLMTGKDSEDITFTYIDNQEPVAFNFYYCKAKDIYDRSNWVTIEENVPVSRLNKQPNSSQDISLISNRYTYTWYFENKDLINIQLIAEPIV